MNKLKLYKDSEIEKEAVGRVLNSHDINLRGVIKNVAGGLFDEYIFGLPDVCACGMNSVPGTTCMQCRIKVYDKNQYKKNFAYYKTLMPFINPIILNLFYSLLKGLGFRFFKTATNHKLMFIMNTEYFIMDTPSQDSIEAVTKSGDKKYIICKEVNDKSDYNMCGLQGLVTLRNMFSTIAGKDAEFLESYIHYDLIIISPAFRRVKPFQVNEDYMKYTVDSEIHYIYKSIIISDNIIRKSYAKLNTVDKLILNYNFNILISRIGDTSELFKSGKENIIRQSFSKRLGSSMRANAVSADNIDIDTIRLPRGLVYIALQSQIIHRLINNPQGFIFDAIQYYESKHPLALKAMEDIVKESKILLLRNPSLHRNNILAYNKLELWDNNSIGVNPTIVKTMNLDYDGDQLAVFFITKGSGLEDLGDIADAKNIWFFDKDLKVVYEFSAIVVYGLYYLTLDSHKPSKGNYKSFKDAQVDYDKHVLDFDDNIVIDGKATTYGRAWVSDILDYDLDKIIGNVPIDNKSANKIIAGLPNRPNHIEIHKKLSSLGAEIATYVGVPALTVKDIYKGYEDKINKLMENDEIPDELKAKMIKDEQKNLMSEELKKYPATNTDILLKGRLNPSTLDALYNKSVILERSKDGVKMKLSDSSVASGLTEKDLLREVQNQRTVLEVKQTILPKGGYNRRQLVIAPKIVTYKKQNSPYKDDYVFYPIDYNKVNEFIDERTKVNANDTPAGFMAIKSCALIDDDFVYTDQLNKRSTSILTDGAILSIAYGNAFTEGITQKALGLKYGVDIDEYSLSNDVLAKNSGKASYDDDYVYVGNQKYIRTKSTIPSLNVINNKHISVGDKIMVNVDTHNVRYRLVEVSNFCAFQIPANTNYERTASKLEKGISYAYEDGIVNYKDGKVYLNNKAICNYSNTTSLFYPDGARVKIGDRLCSVLLDMYLLSESIKDKRYLPWIFAVEANRVANEAARSIGDNYNPDVLEVLFKGLNAIKFNVGKAMRTLINKNDSLISQMYRGYGKKNLTSQLNKIDKLNDKLEVELNLVNSDEFNKLLLKI